MFVPAVGSDSYSVVCISGVITTHCSHPFLIFDVIEYKTVGENFYK